MSDILIFILASRTICRPAPLPVAEADQRFYDTAAPYAGTVRTLRCRIAGWTHRRKSCCASDDC